METPINKLIFELNSLKNNVTTGIEENTIIKCKHIAEKLEYYEAQFLKEYTNESIFRYLVAEYDIKLTYKEWINQK